MFGERGAMIRATASSEAVSVSMRKEGFTRRRITLTQLVPEIEAEASFGAKSGGPSTPLRTNKPLPTAVREK